MCGRFVSTSSPDELADYFGVDVVAEAVLDAPVSEPDYNVAPTKDVFAIVQADGQRHLDAFFWGLIPSWAKEAKIGSKMINARAETLATKNAYRKPFAERRCIIPADGFYEWKVVGGTKSKPKKQPVFITRPDGAPFAFAGLWSVWRGPDKSQEPLRSVTIITTTPNSVLAPIHDRMPVILPDAAWATWLDRDNTDVEALQRLLVPADDSIVTTTPVSTLVNSVRNNGPDLLAPPAEEPLFDA